MKEPMGRAAVEKRKEVIVLGLVDISSFTRSRQLLILCTLVFVFWVVFCVFEQYMFERMVGWNYPSFLTAFELLVMAALAYGRHVVSSGKFTMEVTAPMWLHTVVAVSSWVSRGTSNMSLMYLNYATQIIFKNLKLLLVMAGSVIMLKKTYTTRHYLMAVFLVGSAIMFCFGDGAAVDDGSTNLHPGFQPVGVFYVAISLVTASVLANSQEMLLTQYNGSNLELLVFMNFIGGVIATLQTILTGEFLEAIDYCAHHPLSCVLMSFVSLLMFYGVELLVMLVREFGAVVANGVGTMRKLVTICLSFIAFRKPFSMWYVAGVVSFVLSLALKPASSSSRVVDEEQDTEQETEPLMSPTESIAGSTSPDEPSAKQSNMV